MSNRTECLNTWNRMAGAYRDRFMGLDVYDESYDLFCELTAAEGASVLEIGCGPGNMTRRLLERRPDFRIHAVDYAPAMIELARVQVPNAHFEILDARHIHTLGNKYDAIASGFCLPYLSDEEVVEMIEHIHTLLHDNGILYLSFVPGHPADSGLQTGSTGDQLYFHFYQEEEIISRLHHNGFQLLHHITVPYTRYNGQEESHVVLLARKLLGQEG